MKKLWEEFQYFFQQKIYVIILSYDDKKVKRFKTELVTK